MYPNVTLNKSTSDDDEIEVYLRGHLPEYDLLVGWFLDSAVPSHLHPGNVPLQMPCRVLLAESS